MDTDLLRTFLSVASIGSFTLAAKKLQLTQPALSKRIKRLETIVGTNLFDRVGNHVIETEAGRLLREQAPAILGSIDNTFQDIRDLTGRVSGQLHIGTSHYIGLHLLPDYLEQYIDTYPEVDLNIDFIDSELAYDRVLSGDLELALLTFPSQANPRLEHQLIWQEALQMVCHQDYELLAHDNPMNQLSNYPCILPPAHTFPRELFEHQLETLGVHLGKVKTANYLEVIAKLVACKMGWTLLPERLVSEPLTLIGDSRQLSVRSMGIIYRTNKTLSNAAQALVDLLHQPQ
ncbi:LysR family transcriptional regulator [Kangiella koreensis]|uniref:Transcriptional regulator, LysR family n=1 Tax=Kangiella koreensis (strain DSM 16069 / JCM 12317 / KCTC 12182 / SW-125) TaxID=523791 RepID=C7RAV2_KANKD|nr:LysR family transcriptional regulator [Kangiella koreensis]ACV26394.1 transcriptional regulator, LysR family [Kangiella koreensis DSM 16069]